MSREKHVMYHSMLRIILTSLFLAVIAGVGAYLMLPLLAFDDLTRKDLPAVLTGGGIGLISGVIFLVYIFKSTERFLYEWKDADEGGDIEEGESFEFSYPQEQSY